MINVGDVFIDANASREGRKFYYYILRNISRSQYSIAESWECLVGICDKNEAVATYRIEDHSTEFLCGTKKVDNINVFLRAEEEHERIKEEAKKKQEQKDLRLGGVDQAIIVLWRDGFAPNEIAELLGVSERKAIGVILSVVNEERKKK